MTALGTDRSGTRPREQRGAALVCVSSTGAGSRSEPKHKTPPNAVMISTLTKSGALSSAK